MEHPKAIYRVAVAGLHCRSSVEFVNLKVNELEGVEAASIAADHTLSVFADTDIVAPNDLVRVLVDAGVVPRGEFTLSPVAVEVTESGSHQHVKPPLAVDEPRAQEPAAGLAALVVVSPREQSDSVPTSTEAPAAHGVAEFVSDPAHRVSHLPEELADEPLPLSSANARTSQARAFGSGNETYPSPVVSTSLPPAEPVTAVSASAASVAALEESIDAAIEASGLPASPRASIVQRIEVAVSDNYYPNRIEVIPGIPVEIVFGEGHGCLASVIFEQFGITQDLTQGGAVVRLPGLAPGTYEFSCGKRMVFGTVVAEA